MKKEYLNELLSLGVKCNINDIIFITKDKSGQLVWLETGNENAGLIHIINRHNTDYVNLFGPEVDISSVICEIITNGKIISSHDVIRNGNKGYEKIYDFQGNHYMLSAIGDNGFIVSSFPISIKK